MSNTKQYALAGDEQRAELIDQLDKVMQESGFEKSSDEDAEGKIILIDYFHMHVAGDDFKDYAIKDNQITYGPVRKRGKGKVKRW